MIEAAVESRALRPMRRPVEPGPFVERPASMYSGIHPNLRAVVFGNGPSLEHWIDATFDAVLIGCNRSWRWFPRARYHATVNARHYDDLIRGEFRPHTAFVRGQLRKRYRNLKKCRFRDYVVFVDMTASSDPADISADLTQPVGACFSGLFAIQVALFLGFAEIYLVGFDGHDGEGHVGGVGDATGVRTPQLPFYDAIAHVAATQSHSKIVNC